jgi:hypothetical protein
VNKHISLSARAAVTKKKKVLLQRHLIWSTVWNIQFLTDPVHEPLVWVSKLAHPRVPVPGYLVGNNKLECLFKIFSSGLKELKIIQNMAIVKLKNSQFNDS